MSLPPPGGVTVENWWSLAGAGLAALFVLAALAVPLRVGFRLRAGPEEFEVFAVYDFGGPFRGSVSVPVFRSLAGPRGGAGRSAEEGEEPKEAAPGRAGRGRGMGRSDLVVRALRIAVRAFRRIERFDWTARVGTGDAAYTSWCAGLLWALESAVVAFLSRHVTWLSPPRLSVVPDFDRVLFLVDVTCIFRFRFGDIIVAAAKHFAGRLLAKGV